MTLALTRQFSQNGISSLVINSEETLKRVKTYGKQRVRPIVVVVLTAAEDMDRFVSVKNKYNISYPIWLVIFEDEFGASICDFCKKPTKTFLVYGSIRKCWWFVAKINRSKNGGRTIETEQKPRPSVNGP